MWSRPPSSETKASVRTSGRAARGFSLVEMTVAMLVFGLVLTVIAQLLVPSFTLFGIHTASSESQLQALMFSQRLQGELLNTYSETVTVLENPPTIALHPVRQSGVPFASSDGKPLMEDHFLVFTLDAGKNEIRVLRRSPSNYDFSQSTQPLKLAPQDLVALVGSQAAEDRVLARDVVGLQLSDRNGPVSNNIVWPLKVTVEAEIKTRSRTERWQGTVTATPRNTRW